MKKPILILFTVMGIMLLSACGGGEENTSSNGKKSGGESTVTIEASNWQFDKEEYNATAGDVTINLKNAEGYHGITIDGTNVKIDGEGKATANLEPGEYTIRCSIMCGEGHGEMTATLVVS